MSFAAVARPHSGRATPSLRDAPQQQPMSTIGRGSTYRRRNAVQTNPATSQTGMFSSGHSTLGLSFANGYHLHYAKLDPMPSFVMSQPVGQLVTDEDALPKRAFLNSEFYEDWIKSQGIYSCLYSNAFRRHDAAANLCLTREPGAKSFGGDELSLISRIVPHIGRAADIHFRLTYTDEQRKLLSHALDAVGQEVILVNRDYKLGLLCLPRRPGCASAMA